jgi:hypothetical protein
MARRTRCGPVAVRLTDRLEPVLGLVRRCGSTVGADLTRPYAELLGVEASLDARKALAGSNQTHMTYERRKQ